MRNLTAGLLCLLLGGCSVTADYVGCNPHILQWTFGPEDDVPFLDVCYVQLDISELQQYYSFIPISGNNPDTRQAIDANRDGVGDGIRRNARYYNNSFYWGDRCSVSAIRVVQKGCLKLGNSSRTGGCDWISVHIKAKPGLTNRKVELTPIWHVRLPDGSERDLPAKTMSTGFETCQ